MVKCYKTIPEHMDVRNIIRTDIAQSKLGIEHGLNTVVHMLLELKTLNLTILGKIQQKKDWKS
jgi:hypothetical protein